MFRDVAIPAYRRAAVRLVLFASCGLFSFALLSQPALDWFQAEEPGAGYQYRILNPSGSSSTDSHSIPASQGFRSVPPIAAGVSFTNVVAESHILQNHNYMNGSGVAAGDFDGDGWRDLYFCSIGAANALYRNLGGWRFEDATESAGVGMEGFASTGAAFADLDGDGDLDLLVSTLGQGAHSFLNQGSGTFRETTREAGLESRAGSTTLALGDVDGDGDLDLYVANYGEIPIVNMGVGARVDKVNGKWVIAGPHAKRLRVTGTRLEEVGEPDAFYLNDGNGRFTKVPWSSNFFLDERGSPMQEPWDFGLTVQMRDINGDRAPDLYVCNDFQTPDRIWLNDGSGRFKAMSPLAVRQESFSSMGADFADLDRDGFMDFLVVEMLARRHDMRMRQFSALPPSIPPPGRIEERIAAARNVLHRNRGDGTYAEIARFAGVAATDWSWQPVFLDVDLDGYEDLLVVNGMPRDLQDKDAHQRIRSSMRQSPGEKRGNVLKYPPLPTPNAAYRNRRDLTFEDASEEWGFHAAGVSNGIALADLDNDGDLDAVLNNLNDAPHLYRNESTASRISVRLKSAGGNSQGIGARVKLTQGSMPDQTQEMISGGRYLSGDDAMKTFAVAKDEDSASIEVRWRNGKVSTINNAAPNRVYWIEELDEETRLNENAKSADALQTDESKALFADASRRLNHTHHEELFNDFARQSLLPRMLSQNGPGAAWFDLDGDGQNELAIGTGKGGSMSFYRVTVNGEFESLPIETNWTAPDDVCGLAGWTWANGRRAVLAAVSNYESQSPEDLPVLIECAWNSAARSVVIRELEVSFPKGSSPGALAAADMDADGSLELFVGGRVRPGAYPIPASSMVYRQVNGSLKPDDDCAALLEEAGMVNGAAWSDLTGDGYPELLLACEWGPLRVFRNEGGRLAVENWEVRFKEANTEKKNRSFVKTLQQLTGWWTGVATGDFDGDGRLDIAAGNWGLNDEYQTSFEHPLQIDYLHNPMRNEWSLVESYWAPELNAYVPRRTFNALGQAFPSLIRFGSHGRFGEAPLQEILTDLPSPPSRLTAATLESMVFLNRGDYFLASALPSEAQWSPVFAVNAGDANGDGQEDLFLSQNFFAMRPERTRLDAGRGLWLLGNGVGEFEAIPGHRSGVEAYGEQRGAALADFNRDGRVDLTVAQNAAPTRVFENRTGRRGLRVRLKGPPGNPDGIGAVIRLKSGDQFGPAREVQAGSGYWSQNSTIQIMHATPPPEAVEVVWPGGRKTEAPVTGKSGEIEIRFEGIKIDPKVEK